MILKLAAMIISTTTPDPTAMADEFMFIACVPSAQECQYSCPSLSGFKVEEEEAKCELDDQLPLACYCRVR
jgi:hypothetical protein